MITWLGQPRRAWLAQEQLSPEQAAGQAARDRAQKSSWPPTEEDFEAIGAAAGSAAGAAIGGPAGAAVGAVVGTAVGSAVFLLGDAIAHGLDPNYNPAVDFGIEVRKTLGNIRTTAGRLAEQCGTTQEAEYQALVRWGLTDLGLPDGTLGVEWRSMVQTYGVDGAKSRLTALQKRAFAAAAARAAECETTRARSASQRSIALPLVVGAAAIAGVAWLLLV